MRSAVIQLGVVRVSLAAQAVREAGNKCVRGAALWLTRGDVSQQFELSNSASGTYAISDLGPNAGSVLLTASEEATTLRIAVLPLTDGALKWIELSELLGYTACHYSFEPQGFVDARHIAIAAVLDGSKPTCNGGSFVYIIDPETRKVQAASSANVVRQATVVAEAVPSCQSDPDVNGACYTTRARLGEGKDGAGMVLWPVGSSHLLGVQEGMVPGGLRSEVSAGNRVYATVLVCPLAAPMAPRRFICIASATDLKAEGTKGAAQPSVVVVNNSQ